MKGTCGKSSEQGEGRGGEGRGEKGEKEGRTNLRAVHRLDFCRSSIILKL